MPTCAGKETCRSSSGGLPYCTRFTLSASRLRAVASNVHDSANVVAQPVASPSLIAGKCPARMGSNANGVSPSTNTPAIASSSRQRIKVVGRRSSTAAITAGATRKPAG